MNIQQIKITDIMRDKEQPRKYFDDDSMNRLIDSIKDNGIESPLIVRKEGGCFIIVDGERRWRAAKDAGLSELPCIITDKNDILEQQLRSDCLKEGLTVDELDRAIYRFYELLTSKKSIGSGQGVDQGQSEIAKKIGKSPLRVRKAIDRFEFKRDNREFVKKIEQKHNPENKTYSKVNSTISMTDKLKDKPEFRKEAVEVILENKKDVKFSIDNDMAKRKIDVIARKADAGVIEPKDVKQIFDNLKHREDPIKLTKKDPQYLFQKKYFDFTKFTDSFYDMEFDTVKDHVKSGKTIEKFIEECSGLLKYLENLRR